MKEKIYQVEFTLRDILDVCSQGDGTYTMQGMKLTMPIEYKFGSLDTIKTYANAVVDNYNERHGTRHHPVRVVEGHRNLHRKAYYTNGLARITIPQRDRGSWAWRQLVVLHEIAHHLSPASGHDVEFAETMEDLLRECVGPEAGLVYRILLDQEGIQLGKETQCLI